MLLFGAARAARSGHRVPTALALGSTIHRALLGRTIVLSALRARVENEKVAGLVAGFDGRATSADRYLPQLDFGAFLAFLKGMRSALEVPENTPRDTDQLPSRPY